MSTMLHVPPRSRTADAPSRIEAALEERIVLAPARRLRLGLAEDTILRHAGSGPLRVLDAGCGDGLLALALAKRHPSWSVVGIDLRADLLEAARARAEARHLVNTRFVLGDLTEPLAESGFDVVLSEIPDDERALRILTGALVPGGLLVAHVPDSSWRPILPGSPAEWREQVRQGYEAGELAARLRALGLMVLQVVPTYRATAALAQEVRDRLKRSPLWLRALTFPALAAAVRLERHGVTGGRPRALLAVARVQGGR
jgi:SAM-dependent methyltransferase